VTTSNVRIVNKDIVLNNYLIPEGVSVPSLIILNENKNTLS